MRIPKKIRRLIKSANLGKSESMYRLALMFCEYEDDSFDTPKFLFETDYSYALYLMQEAYSKGHKLAKEWLEDQMFSDGPGVDCFA